MTDTATQWQIKNSTSLQEVNERWYL